MYVANRSAGHPNRAPVESPGEPSADLAKAAATSVRTLLSLWLGPGDPRITELIVNMEQQRRWVAKVERLKADRRANTEAAERRLTQQIQVTKELADAILIDGLKHRAGYRLGLDDRMIFQELLSFGATGQLKGIAVCHDCVRVFVPSRRGTAHRCDECHRHPAPAWEDNGVEGHAYPRMRFDRDPLENDDAVFTGWTTRRFVWCHECDRVFEATRKDAVTCGGACRTARSKRRSAGDLSDLSPQAVKSRAQRDLGRALVKQVNRAAEGGHADASNEILRLLGRRSEGVVDNAIPRVRQLFASRTPKQPD